MALFHNATEELSSISARLQFLEQDDLKVAATSHVGALYSYEGNHYFAIFIVSPWVAKSKHCRWILVVGRIVMHRQPCRQFGFIWFCELHSKILDVHYRFVWLGKQRSIFWRGADNFTKLDGGSWDLCHQSGNCRTNGWHSLLWFPLSGLRSSFNVNTVFLFEFFFFAGD